ncbi:MAG: hypothetical protein KGR26_05920 [Cyanobacteria bacterium REEB65]|nr:hypothetical protein [Cyanobacteria bacterium REEB65]
MSSLALAHPLSASIVLLVVGLGIRHGLDPDHVAAIDGLTFSGLRNSPRVALWSGPLFALGHGLVVTSAILATLALGTHMTMPTPLATCIDWLPVVLLLLMGFLNVRALLQSGPYCPSGWKSRILPMLSAGRSLFWAAPIAGMIFAFDGVPQGFMVGGLMAQNSPVDGLGAGLLMTIAMAAIAAFDSRTLVKLGTADEGRLALYRRISGWAVVGLAFAMAGYEAAALLFPHLALQDTAAMTLGAAIILCVWAARAFGLPLLLERNSGLIQRSC